MKRLTLIFMLTTALLPRALLAQSDAETDAVVIPLYDVEVIIFKNLQVPKSKEFILPLSSPAKDKKIFEIASPKSIAAAKKSGYILLPDTEYRLIEVAKNLVESSRYELLTHASWRQPGLDRAQVLPVWIKGGRIFGDEYTSIDNQIEFLENNPLLSDPSNNAETNFEFDEQSLEALELQLLERQAIQHGGLYELEGKITIALSRYLHTYVDLVLRRPRQSIDSVLNTSSQDLYLAAYSADTRILNNHSLKEHRRMRSKNLHYIDNPEFSMLILITPYEVPENFEEEIIEDDPVVDE